MAEEVGYLDVKPLSESHPGSVVARKPWQERQEFKAHCHGAAMSSSTGDSVPFMKYAVPLSFHLLCVCP